MLHKASSCQAVKMTQMISLVYGLLFDIHMLKCGRVGIHVFIYIQYICVHIYLIFYLQ